MSDYVIENPDAPWHGTAGGRTNHNCKCGPCRAAWATMVAAQRLKRAERLRADPTIVTHGTENAYGNYKCRCKPCTQAWTDASRERAHRRKERRVSAAEEQT